MYYWMLIPQISMSFFCKGFFLLLLMTVFVSGQLPAQEVAEKEDLAQKLADYISPCPKPCLADSVKVALLLQLAEEEETQALEDARNLYREALQLSQEIVWTPGKVRSQMRRAYLRYQAGEYSIARDQYLLALQWINEAGSISLQDEKAEILGRIGATYWNSSKYPEAIDYYLQALKIYEGNGNKLGISTQLGNIGLVYWGLGEYEKALDYHQKALELDRELGNTSGMAADISNIGVVYADMGEHEKALEYYFQILDLAVELGNKRFQAIAMGNIGIAYRDLEQFDKALTYHEKAAIIAQEIQNKRSLAINLGNLGETYLLQQQPAKAENYLLRALAIADTIGAMDVKKYQLQTLAYLYEKTGQFEKALQYFRQFSQVKDSIFSLEKEQDILRKNLEYEYEKNQLEERAGYERQLAIMEAAKHRSTLLGSFVGISLLVTLIFMGFVVRSLRLSRRQTRLIQEQKQLVESHQQEIIDSITYAKSLQSAIMPGKDRLNLHLKEHFIFYQPKDIIAGDFFWMEATTSHIFLAVADCTGHGVSGAMISIVCGNALDRAVKEAGLLDPGDILNRVNSLVQSSLNRNEADFSDGMDIILLVIDKTQQEIWWSGANLPLWVYRHKGATMDKYHPTKQPIGTHFKKALFVTQRITFDPDDVAYLFSDGFQDQFGGDLGKKYMKKNFETLLLAHAQDSLQNQESVVTQEFERWKRGLFQVDDVTVMGVKL